MNDDTEAAKLAKGKKKGAGAAGAKGGKKPEAEGGAKSKVEGQVARLLVRAIWMQEWSANNPEGKPEERKKAWMDARQSATDHHLKSYRRAISNLIRAGVSINYTPQPKKSGGAAEDDDGED